MANSLDPHPRINNFTAALGALILLVTLFGHLGAIGLVGPDEPRYAWISRAMSATGDWVTPRLYGQPWFEKPILYYWAAAVGFLLHLPAEWALRLPSALAALAAALAIGWLAWQHYGDAPARVKDPAVLAPLLFCSTVAAVGFSRAATPDMLFSASLALAMASAATVLRYSGDLRSAVDASARPNSARTLPLILFGVFAGLGVLAKGPAALILAAGALGLWALVTQKWRPALRLAHPWAIVAFCLVALPWYVLCAWRNPDFVRVFILQHNFERYLTPVFQHRQPFWFFGPIALLALLPWTALLWPAGQEGIRLWRERSWHNSPGLFFACWAVFPILFFSFSQSKLPGYILPAIPPLALLCAISPVRASSNVSPQTSSALKVAIGLTWLAIGLSALAWLHRQPMPLRENIARPVLFAAALAIVAGLCLASLPWFRKRGSVLPGLLLMAFLVEFAGLAILPRLDPYVSARWHAELLHNNRHPDRIFMYQLPRSWAYGLAFYLGRELPEWSVSDPDPALVLTTPHGLQQIRQSRRFFGELDEAYRGILYVPIGPLPRRDPAQRGAPLP